MLPEEEKVDGILYLNRMAKEFSFPKENRLKRRLHFKLVFEEGLKIENETLTVWYLNNPKDCDFTEENKNLKKVKVGIIVSKKLGNSVKRNRIKRVLREAFRLSANQIRDGMWLIISPKKNIENLWQATDELNKIFKKAGILKQ